MNTAEGVYGTFGSGGDWGLETGGTVENREESTVELFEVINLAKPLRKINI